MGCFLAIIHLMWIINGLGQKINPLDYVWYDYGSEVAIEDYSSTFAAAALPCKTRIGQCKLAFSILPPNW